MLNSTILHLMSIPIIILIIIFLLKKKYNYKHIVLFVFFAIYVVGLLSITLFPIPIQKKLIVHMAGNDYIKYNYILLKSIINIFSHNNLIIALRQVAGNIILFIPFGYLTPVLFNKNNSFKSIIILGLISSLLVELFQGLLPLIIGTKYKVVDIDDVLLNVIGVVLGYIFYKFLKVFQMKYSLNFIIPN